MNIFNRPAEFHFPMPNFHKVMRFETTSQL